MTLMGFEPTTSQPGVRDANHFATAAGSMTFSVSNKESLTDSFQESSFVENRFPEESATNIIQMTLASLTSRPPEGELEPTVKSETDWPPSLSTSLQWSGGDDQTDELKQTDIEDRGQSSESSQRFLEDSSDLSVPVSLSSQSAMIVGHAMSLEEQSLSVKTVCPDTDTPQSEELQDSQQDDSVPQTSDTDLVLEESLALGPLSAGEGELTDNGQLDMAHERSPSQSEKPRDTDGRSSPSWMEKVATTAKDAYSSLGKRLSRKKKKTSPFDEEGEQGIDEDFSGEDYYTDSDEDREEDEKDECNEVESLLGSSRDRQPSDESETMLVHAVDQTEESEDTLYDSELRNRHLPATSVNMEDRTFELSADMSPSQPVLSRTLIKPTEDISTREKTESQGSKLFFTQNVFPGAEKAEESFPTQDVREDSMTFSVSEKESLTDSLQESHFVENRFPEESATGIIQMTSASLTSRPPEKELEPTAEPETDWPQSLSTSLQWSGGDARTDEQKQTDIEDRGQSSESSQRFLEDSSDLSVPVSLSSQSAMIVGHAISLEEQSLSVKTVCPDTDTPQSEELQGSQQDHSVPQTSDTDLVLKESLALGPLSSGEGELTDNVQLDMAYERSPSQSEEPRDTDGRSSPSWMEKVVTTAKDAYSSLGRRLRRKKKMKSPSDEEGEQDTDEDFSGEEDYYTDSDEDREEDEKDESNEAEGLLGSSRGRQPSDASDTMLGYAVDQIEESKGTTHDSEFRDRRLPATSANREDRTLEMTADMCPSQAVHSRSLMMPTEDLSTWDKTDSENSKLSFTENVFPGAEEAEESFPKQDAREEDMALSVSNNELLIPSLNEPELNENRFIDESVGKVMQMPSATVTSLLLERDLEPTVESETDWPQSLSTSLQWSGEDDQTDELKQTQSDDGVQSSESSQRFLEDSSDMSVPVSLSSQSAMIVGHAMSLEEQNLSVTTVCPDTDTPQSEELRGSQQDDSLPQTSDTDLVLEESLALGPLSSENGENADNVQSNMAHEQSPSQSEEPRNADGRSSPSWMEKVVSTAKDTYSSLGKRLRRKKKKPPLDEDGEHDVDDDFSGEEDFSHSGDGSSEDSGNENDDDERLFHFPGVSPLPDTPNTMHIGAVHNTEETEAMHRTLPATSGNSTQSEDRGQSAESSQRFLEDSSNLSVPVSLLSQSAMIVGHAMSLEEQSLSVKTVCPDTDTLQSEELQGSQQDDSVPQTSDTDLVLEESLALGPLSSGKGENTDDVQLDITYEQSPSQSEEPRDADGRSSPSWMEKVVTTTKDAYTSLGKKLRRKKKSKSRPDEDGGKDIGQESSGEEAFTDSEEDSVENDEESCEETENIRRQENVVLQASVEDVCGSPPSLVMQEKEKMLTEDKETERGSPGEENEINVEQVRSENKLAKAADDRSTLGPQDQLDQRQRHSVSGSAPAGASYPTDHDKNEDDDSSFTEEESASLSPSDEEEPSLHAEGNAESETLHREMYFGMLTEKKNLGSEDTASSDFSWHAPSSELHQKVLDVQELPTNTAVCHDSPAPAYAERSSTLSTCSTSPADISFMGPHQDMGDIERSESSLVDSQQGTKTGYMQGAEEDTVVLEQVMKQAGSQGTEQDVQEYSNQVAGLDGKTDAETVIKRRAPGVTDHDFDAAIVAAVLDADRRLSKSLSDDPSLQLSDVDSDNQDTENDRNESPFYHDTGGFPEQVSSDDAQSHLQDVDGDSAECLVDNVTASHRSTERAEISSLQSSRQPLTQHSKDHSSGEDTCVETTGHLPVEDITSDREETAHLQAETNVHKYSDTLQDETDVLEKVYTEADELQTETPAPRGDTDDSTVMLAVMEADTRLQSEHQVNMMESQQQQQISADAEQGEGRSSWLDRAVETAKDAYSSLGKRLKRKPKEGKESDGSLEEVTSESSGAESGDDGGDNEAEDANMQSGNREEDRIMETVTSSDASMSYLQDREFTDRGRHVLSGSDSMTGGENSEMRENVMCSNGVITTVHQETVEALQSPSDHGLLTHLTVQTDENDLDDISSATATSQLSAPSQSDWQDNMSADRSLQAELSHENDHVSLSREIESAMKYSLDSHEIESVEKLPQMFSEHAERHNVFSEDTVIEKGMPTTQPLVSEDGQRFLSRASEPSVSEEQWSLSEDGVSVHDRCNETLLSQPTISEHRQGVLSGTSDLTLQQSDEVSELTTSTSELRQGILPETSELTLHQDDDMYLNTSSISEHRQGVLPETAQLTMQQDDQMSQLTSSIGEHRQGVLPVTSELTLQESDDISQHTSSDSERLQGDLLGTSEITLQQDDEMSRLISSTSESRQSVLFGAEELPLQQGDGTSYLTSSSSERLQGALPGTSVLTLQQGDASNMSEHRQGVLLGTSELTLQQGIEMPQHTSDMSEHRQGILLGTSELILQQGIEMPRHTSDISEHRQGVLLRNSELTLQQSNEMSQLISNAGENRQGVLLGTSQLTLQQGDELSHVATSESRQGVLLGAEELSLQQGDETSRLTSSTSDYRQGLLPGSSELTLQQGDEMSQLTSTISEHRQGVLLGTSELTLQQGDASNISEHRQGVLLGNSELTLQQGDEMSQYTSSISEHRQGVLLGNSELTLQQSDEMSQFTSNAGENRQGVLLGTSELSLQQGDMSHLTSSSSERLQSVLPGASELTMQQGDGISRPSDGLSLASTYALSLPADYHSYASAEDSHKTMAHDPEVLLQVCAAEASYEETGRARTFLGDHVTRPPRQFSTDGTCDVLEADDRPLIGNEAAGDENEASDDDREAAEVDQENINPDNMPLSSLFKTTKGKKNKSKKGKGKDATETNVANDATSPKEAQAEEQTPTAASPQASDGSGTSPSDDVKKTEKEKMADKVEGLQEKEKEKEENDVGSEQIHANSSDAKTDVTSSPQDSAAVLYTTESRDVTLAAGEGPQLSPSEGEKMEEEGGVVDMQPAKADGSLPPETPGREKQSLLHDHNPEGMVCCTIL